VPKLEVIQTQINVNASGTSAKATRFSTFYTTSTMRPLHQRYTLSVRSYDPHIKGSFHFRYTERNDTYIFVPEGEAQSLTIHRSSGDIVLNCKFPCDVWMYTYLLVSASAQIHRSLRCSKIGKSNLWHPWFNIVDTVYHIFPFSLFVDHNPFP